MKIVQNIQETVTRLKERYDAMGRTERTRTLVLGISLMLILNYLLFCYHTDKNIFDIFPSIPVLDSRQEIQVYLPDDTAQKIISEKRRILINDDQIDYVRTLFNIVVKGSQFENTSNVVPIAIHIRKVWIWESNCYIDISHARLKENAKSIEGSEAAFKKALEKTITANIPSIKHVTMLVSGIPDMRMW
ncbi:MAG TPA: GerMN domain-containing protein [Spirochaetota bacterium]|nr:GerMN domain-containing protein [Spirochaetota bacterium]